MSIDFLYKRMSSECKILLLSVNHKNICDCIQQNLLANNIHNNQIVVDLISDEQKVDDDAINDMLKYSFVVMIGASLDFAIKVNNKIRSKKNDCKMIVADVIQSSMYSFIDFGSSCSHVSLQEYIQLNDCIKSKFSQVSVKESSLKAFDYCLSGFVSGRIRVDVTSTDSQQFLCHDFDPRLLEDLSIGQRSVLIVGCGSVAFHSLKILLDSGVRNFILIDPDVVHKYNIKPYHCFTHSHLGLQKCQVLKDLALAYCNDAHVEAYCAQIQQAPCDFWTSMTEKNAMILSTVDHMSTKRYINKMCLENCLPFIDVGIDGYKFHVQVFVPHLTDSYTSFPDEPDIEYPYCVLKTFPVIIEHCIEWAKMKFVKWFNQRPKVASTWKECIEMARIQFEKCFNHKPQQILHNIPSDRINEDGSFFWSDKRVPHHFSFSVENEVHFRFVKHLSLLIASVNNILVPDDDKFIEDVIQSTSIPLFVPKRDKRIITDPTERQQKVENDDDSSNDGFKKLVYTKDDENQLQFIFVASSLRAMVYDIDTVSELDVYNLSHKVISCSMSTITAASSFASMELLKISQMGSQYLDKSKLDSIHFTNKNYYGNVSIGLLVNSQPGKPLVTHISPTYGFTEWDHWMMKEAESLLTLDHLLNYLKERTGLTCTTILMDAKSIYFPEIFPQHAKRRKQLIRDLIANYYKPIPKFVTFEVMFKNPEDDGEEDVAGPNLKFHFSDDSN